MFFFVSSTVNFQCVNSTIGLLFLLLFIDSVFTHVQSHLTQKKMKSAEPTTPRPSSKPCRYGSLCRFHARHQCKYSHGPDESWKPELHASNVWKDYLQVAFEKTNIEQVKMLHDIVEQKAYMKFKEAEKVANELHSVYAQLRTSKIYDQLNKVNNDLYAAECRT